MKAFIKRVLIVCITSLKSYNNRDTACVKLNEEHMVQLHNNV